MPPPLPEPAPSSPLSSPNSFITATASPRTNPGLDPTDISSPGDDGPDRPYRKASQLPRELRQYCQIYLEENLHGTALTLFNGLLQNGLRPPDALEPRAQQQQQPRAHHATATAICCPPPNHLALLSAIVVHPDFTNRPRDGGSPEAANGALSYLRNLLHTVGPLHGRFKEAFHFGTNWSRGNTPDAPDDDDAPDDASVDAPLEGKYFKDSVWRRGHDFFGLVGWAFNCSVLYPNRWEYWRQWMEFMLDVLEADLHERHRLDREANRAGGRDEDSELPLLQDAILAGYMASQQKGRMTGGLKWIMKALFADGGPASSSLFKEMWPKEHRGLSKKDIHKRKREQVNIEKGEYGAWLDDESIYSSQASEPPTPQKFLGKHKYQPLVPSFFESIELRQRLFALTSYLCNYLPEPPIDLPDLYEAYVHTMKEQPLSPFVAFVTSTTSSPSLRVESQITLLQDILMLFMPAGMVAPAKVDPASWDANGTSAAILERCFLPCAANTITADHNAKVSVLLEELLQIAWVHGPQDFSPGLMDIVRKGVSARETKVRKKAAARGRGRGAAQADEAELEARTVLEDSGRRLLQLARTILTRPVADEEDEEMADGRFLPVSAGGSEAAADGAFRPRCRGRRGGVV